MSAPNLDVLLILYALILVGGFGTRLRPLTVSWTVALAYSSCHGPSHWSSFATRYVGTCHLFFCL